MWKQKIGISVGNKGWFRPMSEVMQMLKKIGFDAVSPEWEKDVNMDEVVKAARDAGLEIQSLHAPFSKMSWLWQQEMSEEDYPLDGLFASLEVCKKHSIPVLIVHCWTGFKYEDVPNEIGLQNYRKLVERAKE